MKKRIASLITIIRNVLNWIRERLNSIRSKNPQAFDKAVKIIEFLITFISCFTPALATNYWIRVVLEFILLSLILVLQWSTYTNRIIKLKKDLTSAEEKINSFNQDDYCEKIKKINQRFDNMVGFSHSISDSVKKITAEISKPIDSRVVTKVTGFLQQSLSSLEMLLTAHYEKNIRASIKIKVNKRSVKTYARGKNNIESRGGEYQCCLSNRKCITVKKNYAYIAIIEKQRKFFAEGNLQEMHNKFRRDDVFFCEHGDNYYNLFKSTIVMPIRIPVFTDLPSEQNEPLQNIFGMLCIDCEDEMPEWSSNTLTEQRAYHLIADYADSLAILIKEYRDAS